MINKDLIKKVSSDLNVEYDVVEDVYNKYFSFIKINIEKNNLIGVVDWFTNY